MYGAYWGEVSPAHGLQNWETSKKTDRFLFHIQVIYGFTGVSTGQYNLPHRLHVHLVYSPCTSHGSKDSVR